MYVDFNPKTKRELVDAVKAGREVYAFQPGGLFPGTKNGRAYIEGPHYPAPHSWYATVLLDEGRIVEVLK
jgi:hypothetical protein